MTQFYLPPARKQVEWCPNRVKWFKHLKIEQCGFLTLPPSSVFAREWIHSWHHDMTLSRMSLTTKYYYSTVNFSKHVSIIIGITAYEYCCEGNSTSMNGYILDTAVLGIYQNKTFQTKAWWIVLLNFKSNWSHHSTYCYCLSIVGKQHCHTNDQCWYRSLGYNQVEMQQCHTCVTGQDVIMVCMHFAVASCMWEGIVVYTCVIVWFHVRAGGFTSLVCCSVPCPHWTSQVHDCNSFLVLLICLFNW